MLISPITRVDHCEASAAAPTSTVSQGSQGIALLEAAFALNEFPSAEQRRTLAAVLEASTRQVTVWFQNRRARGLPLPVPRATGF